MLRIAALALAWSAMPALPTPSAHLERSIERSRDAQSRDWTYAEPDNNCTATRTHAGAWIQLRLTRWNDLSDSILFHRPGLAPLWSEEGAPTGRTEARERADADAFYHLEVRIDGRPIEMIGGFNAMILDYQGRPGPTYRFGIRQQPFLRALARGRTLELYQRDRRLAAIPITGLATTARRMARCVDLPTE